MSEAEILVIKNVTKKFGGLVAVNNESFKVREGEILGLIGPNGAGKTTLFRVIAGIYKPESGRIIFKGKDITGKPAHQVARMGIALTHQIVRPFGDLSVLENVMVGALYGKLAGKIGVSEAIDIAIEKLKFVGLYHKADELASKLTLREKKALELARALAAQPDLLLLDEALAGLNPREVDENLRLIRRVKEEMGLTIIMVEHVMHAVMNIAERLIVLHYGEKIAEGPPEAIANNVRDLEYDKSVNIKTIPIAIGRDRALSLLMTLLILPYIITFILVIINILTPLTLMTLATITEVYNVIRRFKITIPEDADPQVVRVALHYGLLLIAAMIIGDILGL